MTAFVCPSTLAPKSILQVAMDYATGDLSVIPVHADGSKRPVGLWDEYKSRRATAQEITRWFGPNHGIGVVCGAVSGNLEVVDFDASLYEPWRDLVNGIAPGLVDRLTIHKTPNGWHIIYRCTSIGASTKLASRRSDAKNSGKRNTQIETRGEGAQILVPGCAPECHETGRLYVHAGGPPITAAPIISPEEREILLSAARTFERVSPHWRPFEAPHDLASSSNWELRPGDDFNERVSWQDVLPLAGWKTLYTSKGVTYWQRPDKQGNGGSATTGYCGDLLYVFSSNAHPFEHQKSYTKFAAYTVLHFGGDFKAAAKQLADEGYGTVSPHRERPSAKSGALGDASFRAYRAPSTPWPAPPSAPAFQGIAGQVVQRIEPHSEADPAALLIQFLIAFGSIIGRTAHFVAESTRHYLNLFAVLVGATAKGRKGSSWSNIHHVSRAADEIWADTRVLTGLSSGEGLIWNVRDRSFKREAIKEKGRVIDYQEVEVDAGIADKRLLIVEPEFANVFKVAGREGNTLSPIIRLAWDTGMLQSLAKNSPAKATGAHISLIGHITDEELRRNINETEKANGFANRFLWFCVRRSKLLPEGGGFHRVPIGELVETLCKAVNFASTVGELTRDAEARLRWHKEYAQLSEGQPGMLGAILGGAEAQVMRLACVYALLDLSVTIRVQHLEAALAVWDYCERSARYIFGNSLGDVLADELMNMLRRNPEGTTRQGIHDAFNRHRSKADIERALTALETKGLARFEKRESGGRPAEVWFPAHESRALSAESAESLPTGGDTALNAHNAQPLGAPVAASGDAADSGDNGEVAYDL